MSNLYKINELDNVAVNLDENGSIPFGHKVALCDMKKGDKVIKYANPIGTLTQDVKEGEHIHDHNLKTNLSDKLEYKFNGDNAYKPQKSELTFDGYVRADGRVGTRNELWIITTVGCVSETAKVLEQRAREIISDDIDGVFAYSHPYGCSQMGDDQENTRKILAKLIKHENAGGVLVVSLGCENTNIGVLKNYLGNYDDSRIKFLVTQNSSDEIAEGVKLISEIYNNMKSDKRTPVGIDKLCVGYKCGGSDAFSGITANALCGRLTDKLAGVGASCILTEVPEMFGAEHLLLGRCENEATFNKAVDMINNFKDYFASHNQVCYENPSPGNHDGGITTLEEKSLGCIQKGGNTVVTDVLEYGESVTKGGLTLLTGSGNDIVSTTNLTCAGANIILFTTGRGTPLGAPVPTVKIASNTPLASRKQNWIDFDAMSDNNADDLLKLVIEVASGRAAKNEQNGFRQIAIFKNGVTM